MYKWQTDGSISWRDGYYNSHPDLPLSVSTTEWDNAYAAFSGSWSLFGIVQGILDLIAAIPTGRYWLDPVDNDALAEPAAVVTGARYMIPGTATSGANWMTADGGNPAHDCIAVCTAGSSPGPVAWEYIGDPATWTAPDHNLDDGASVWNLYEDSYWVYDATGAAWIQCGGSTLDKVETVTTIGTYVLNSTTHRGTTFLAGAGGNITFQLPALVEGVRYRFVRNTSAGSNHVDIKVTDGENKNILFQARSLMLDASGTPVLVDQTYRDIRLIAEHDVVEILGVKSGWQITFLSGTIKDRGPEHSGTAQGAADSTHVTLEATASAVNEDYLGRLIYITACSGAPTAVGQIREITAYNGTSKVATISPAWTVNPDSTATYEMVEWDSAAGGLSEIGTAYMNPDMDAYDDVGGLMSGSEFPTLSRCAGLNISDTWGALLLGRGQYAHGGAKFATVFGDNSHARWDNQMVFGCSAEQGGGLAQVSRIIMSGSVSGDGGVLALNLGSKQGETNFVTEVDKVYYVTFSVTAHVSPSGGTIPKYISWSGSFLAKNDPDDSDLEIIAGSKNITETANEGSPALSLDITVSGTDTIEFQATNDETDPNCIAIFIGFADVIEHKLTHNIA